MEETKSLCAKISLELHSKVRLEQENCGMNLNQYMEELLTEYYRMKAGVNMSGATRTLAFQIDEELFNELKEYLKRTNQSQKAFMIKLIEDVLACDKAMVETEANKES